jgi:hypothetical protein
VVIHAFVAVFGNSQGTVTDFEGMRCYSGLKNWKKFREVL